MAEPMVETILFLISIHLNPNWYEMIPASAAASNNAIWFAPDRVSSKNNTFRVNIPIKTKMGRSAMISEACRFILINSVFLKKQQTNTFLIKNGINKEFLPPCPKKNSLWHKLKYILTDR